MNKTLRKAMLSTIAMLVVGVMSLTGVTYAWFSAAQQATVEEFNVTVETAEGALAISTDLSTWTSKVTKPTVGVYAPVSTTNALASGKFVFYSAKLATDKSKINVQTAAAADLAANNEGGKKGWTEMTIYFQNQGANSVTVDLMGTTITSANDAILATRIGMASWGSVVDNGQVRDESFSQAPTTGVIYEPYALYHTQNGANDSGKPVVPADGTTKATYYGLKGVTEDMTDDKAVSRKVATDISSEVTTVTSTADASMQITVPGRSIAKVTFYIWLEGQDCDCMNDVAGTAFTVNLKFTNIAATTDRPAADANQTLVRGS